MADEQKEVVDVFGVERSIDTGKPIVPEPETKPEPKLGTDGKPVVEEKKPADVTAELEKNPLVVELRTSITDLTAKLTKETGDKSAMGQNLSKLRERLDKLEKGDTSGGAEPVFKKEEIKRVKDYTADEQEAFTPAEKALIESNADMKERINTMVATEAAKTAERDAAAGSADEIAKKAKEVNDHITAVVQPLAMKYADKDAGIANEIIANFNMFAGNDTADDAELTRRMEKAALMTPTYVAKKEQKSPAGGAVDNAGTQDDPHGINAIVENAGKANSGKGFAL